MDRRESVVERWTLSDGEQIVDRSTEAEARAEVRNQAIAWLDKGYLVVFNGYRASAWDPISGKAFCCATRSSAVTLRGQDQRRTT